MARTPAGQGLWIRVNARDPRDVGVWRVAGALGIPAPYAFGLISSVWCGIAEHQKDGMVGGIPDALLEHFAGWTGQPGAFAAAFRLECVNPEGQVTDWPEKMGKLLKENEAAAERMRALRDRRRSSTDNGRIPHISGTIPETDEELFANSARTSLRIVGGVGEGAAPEGADAPSPRLVEDGDGVGEPATNGSRTATSLPAAITGQDATHTIAAYNERMARAVLHFEAQREGVALDLRREAAAEAVEKLGPDAPPAIVERTTLGIYREKVRAWMRWPTYDQWVKVQHEADRTRAATAPQREG